MDDLPVMLKIYQHARELMAANGNPTQWGNTFPREEVILDDIRQQRTMLLVEPFFAACIVMKMSLRGAGDTRRVMFISYGIMGFFRVVCTWVWFKLAPETMTLWGIWLLFAFEMAVQSTILYKIVKGRSWTKLQV